MVRFNGGPAPLGTIIPFQLDPANSLDLLSPESSGSSILGPSLSPPASTSIIVALISRRDSEHSHSSVTAGFATVAGFTELVTIIGDLDTGGRVRVSLWRAVTTATPGSGAITGTFSSTAYQRAMGAMRLSGVGTVHSTLSAAGGPATSVGATFDPVIAASDVVVALFAQNTDVGTQAFADGLTMMDGGFDKTNANLTVGVGWRNSGAADTQTVTGVSNPRSRALVAAAFRGA